MAPKRKAGDAKASSLEALEATILTSIQTLDRIEEFALPSENPDNAGLAFNLNKLVDDLNNINAASEGLDDIEVPIELVQHFIDEGRSPDEYFAQQYAHVQELSESVRGKQEAFRKLEAAVREQGASLLNDDES